MYQVKQITADPFQQQSLILPDGSSILIQIRFAPMQYGWFITTLSYKNFTVGGIRIVNSPNFLRQFKNTITFGMGCFSAADREPSQQQDFSSGASTLFVLSSAEVAAYETFLKNG